MLYLAFFMFVPYCVAVLLFITLKGVTFKEFMLYTVAHVCLFSLISCMFLWGNNTYTEIYNGTITSKYSKKESCEHSYRCNCHTECSGSGKNKSCHEECDTCYEHPYDISWYVKDTAKERFEITRVNRQGTREPERWTKVQIGDPTASLHSYKNYIKGSNNILKEYVETDYPEALPEYPNNVYDYYKLNRYITINYPYLQSDIEQLSKINGDLGPTKECNIIVIIMKDKPKEIANAIMSKWGGGNKNDIIVMVNVIDQNIISWTNIFAMTQSKTLQVKLRDAIMDMHYYESIKFLEILRNNVALYFDREEMKNYKYLEYDINLETWQIVLGLLLGFSFSIGSLIFLHKNEVI